MNNISYFIFLFLYTFTASEDSVLDSGFLNHLIHEVDHFPGSKDDKFLEIVWNKIVEFFPDSAITPPIEEGITNPEDDYYKCTTESEVSLKLGRMIPGEATNDPHRRKIFVEVYAELIMDKHPMNFKVVFKEAKEAPKPPVSIDYKFTGKNTLSLHLEIPDFSNHDEITGQCLVIIHNIEVIKVGLPEVDWEKIESQEEKDFVKRYRELSALLSKDLRETLTMAIVKAMKKQMKLQSEGDENNEPDMWICASNYFRRASTSKHEGDFDYSPKYKKYCDAETIKH